jgi:hypothetical protein
MDLLLRSCLFGAVRRSTDLPQANSSKMDLPPGRNATRLVPLIRMSRCCIPRSGPVLGTGTGTGRPMNVLVISNGTRIGSVWTSLRERMPIHVLLALDFGARCHLWIGFPRWYRNSSAACHGHLMRTEKERSALDMVSINTGFVDAISISSWDFGREGRLSTRLYACSAMEARSKRNIVWWPVRSAQWDSQESTARWRLAPFLQPSCERMLPPTRSVSDANPMLAWNFAVLGFFLSAYCRTPSFLQLVVARCRT